MPALCQRRSGRQVALFILCLISAMLPPWLVEAQKLPKGVILAKGVVLPKDFELPKGLEIPAGFEITQEIIDQYMAYLDGEESDGPDPISGDQWFKELANEHPNSAVQMNVQKVDAAGANEESEFKDRLLETLLNKDVILPTISVVIAVAAIWAFMTKCGQRSCCKESVRHEKVVSDKKSVKSERSETVTNNDIESNLEKQTIGADSDDLVSQKDKNKSSSKQVVQLSSTIGGNSPAKEGNHSQRATYPLGTLTIEDTINTQGVVGRVSSLSAPSVAAQSTANRLSLPTVSVPLNQIKQLRQLQNARITK